MKFLVSLILALVPATALGQIDSSQLSSELRTHDKIIPTYSLAADTTANTIGTLGVILANTAGTIGAATSLTVSSGFGAPPYASRLIVQMHDNDAGAAVACAKIVVEGRNARGFPVKSILESVGEAATSITSHAFERVDRMIATGCTGTAANDRIHIRASQWVSVDRKIDRASDIVSICQRAPATGEDMICVAGSVCTVDAFSGTVDVSSCTGLGAATRDGLVIRVRN